MVNGYDDLGRINAKLAGGTVQDPAVRLMGNDPINVISRKPIGIQGLMDDGRKIDHSVTEHFLANHADVANRLGR